MAGNLSIAIFETLEGHEADALQLFGIAFLRWRPRLQRDSIHRQAASPRHYVLLRHWRSEEDRHAALEDPELQKIWAVGESDSDCQRVRDAGAVA